ncbi:hypothetical protein A4A49_29099 [Nicotiana attenuata]|uniref:Uncharacterized protein n=1 Tax=Nicotiana attenuata TaxID=49451 RepID=A0A1J6KLQ9_NICAT|nr:hypothetical protein A4A49_29099 [Nicotiana attenuata]
MEPPDGAAPTRLGGQPTPSNTAIQPSDPINTKLAYAIKVISSSNAPTPSNCHGREAVIATHTTHNGMPPVLFKATDYYGVMAEECKLTIVGRFLKPRPQIDKIRSKFKELISIKGSVKIGVYDMSANVASKVVAGFKAEEDLLIAPVWVLLPGLPFHMHTWNYVKQVVSAIGTPLEMDLATKGRTRPSMAKVRVEIDLLKDQPNSVYVGQTYDNAPQKGFVQKIEYEGVPKYCKFCRKLGHNLIYCRALERKKAAENRDLDTLKAAENQNEDNRGIVDRNLEDNTALNRRIGTEHAVKQSEHAENQNEATQIDQNMKLLNRGMVTVAATHTDQNMKLSNRGIVTAATTQIDQNRGTESADAFNREAAKQIDQKRGTEPAESTTAVNTGRLKTESLQGRGNNTIENDMNAQGKPKEDEQRDQAKASNDHAKVVNGQTKAVSEQLSLRIKLHRDMQEDTENRATKEDMQKSIRENVSQNVKRDTENKKMQKSALNISDYVNESTSMPSEIRNLPRIEMVVDLNMESKSKQERYVTSQQIEVTSPNRVTVMVPEDQIQTDSKDESLQIICSKERKKKIGKKNKSKDTTPPKEGHSC